jgi:hypothetical protein
MRRLSRFGFSITALGFEVEQPFRGVAYSPFSESSSTAVASIATLSVFLAWTPSGLQLVASGSYSSEHGRYIEASPCSTTLAFTGHVVSFRHHFCIYFCLSSVDNKHTRRSPGPTLDERSSALPLPLSL